MLQEQQKDPEILQIVKKLKSETPKQNVNKKYLLIEEILNYISNSDDLSGTKVIHPGSYKNAVMDSYHDLNGHMGIIKVFNSIKQKYFWPNLYKDLYEYITGCLTCQLRSSKKTKPPLQETDIPPYPFAKIGFDLSGPYPMTLSGNRYISSFICLLSGWVEAFAVPNKESINILHLFLEEIFPRFSCPLAVLTDNRSENALAAIRFNVNESTKFSPYFLLYNRDPVLHIDNILKPRRKYYGEEEHKIALQEQHKSFVLVHKHLKRAKKRQAKYANKNAKEVKLEVGDPVYLKHHRRHKKHGSTTKAHAEHLRPAVNIDEWEIPKDNNKRVLRATQYVVSPDQSENSSENDSDNVPLIQIAKRFRRERQYSSSESDIPKMKLSNKFNQKQLSLNIENEYDSDLNSKLFNQTTDIDYNAGNDNYDKSTDNDMLFGVFKSIDHFNYLVSCNAWRLAQDNETKGRLKHECVAKDSSAKETKYVRPGEMIELKCPYRKTANDTPHWLFEFGDKVVTVTDNSEINPTLQNLSFTIVQNKLNETFDLSITNITCQHEGTYKCITTDHDKIVEETFLVYLKSM
ncbi:unnamed protein product [Mytilus coruscus]|uniref:Integrase catalytic domain-containing protein n=1 Tax=Mytilus coruscus TaxID=42192 RepID=A0A6J8DY60_MYTCO|nr:unnamed protein product [Mytilus coruscus]